jgi:broad specificity phosphatase PhoE
MMRRLFWFILGAGLAIFVYRKIRESLKKASPEAIGHRVAESASGVGERAQDFAARVRAGMAERETELRETLGLPE